MFSFIWPWIFILTPLPWLVYRIAPKASGGDAALLVPYCSDLAAIGGGVPAGVRKVSFSRLLLIVGWLLLLTASARPQWIGDPVSMPTSGRDLLLAVDISGSMAEEDMVLNGSQTSRITLVKEVVNEFVDRRRGDRVGLILFGTQAYVQAPLTFDLKTVRELFNEAQLGFAGPKTSIGDAIGLAVKRLKERPAESRILILLTDGSNTAGNIQPLNGAELAATTGIKVYTIGVGADEMLVRDFFGTRRVNPSADLDEETLTKIAETTGGRYFRARNPDELEDIYRMIDKMEPVIQESETYRPVKELFFWPLGVVLIVSFAASLINIVRNLIGSRIRVN